MSCEPRPTVGDDQLAPDVVAEGCADYFFGRPLDANPYTRSFEPYWTSWREGWLEGQFYDEARGETERARWRS